MKFLLGPAISGVYFASPDIKTFYSALVNSSFRAPLYFWSSVSDQDAKAGVSRRVNIVMFMTVLHLFLLSIAFTLIAFFLFFEQKPLILGMLIFLFLLLTVLIVTEYIIMPHGSVIVSTSAIGIQVRHNSIRSNPIGDDNSNFFVCPNRFTSALQERSFVGYSYVSLDNKLKSEEEWAETDNSAGLVRYMEFPIVLSEK